MAVAIFDRQLRAPPVKEPFSPGRESLRIMTPQDWAAWATDMPPPPKCQQAWLPQRHVAWHQGVEVLKPVRADGAPRFCFLRDGVFAGEVSLGQTRGWPAIFLENLGSVAAAEFTVQDWLDEFEIDLATFSELLDVLYHQGVVREVSSPLPSAAPAQPPAAEAARSTTSETEVSAT
jgi:hypothetical protein